jgi:porphobilinogen synthase
MTDSLDPSKFGTYDGMELSIPIRPRRNRKSPAIRSLVQEHRLHPSDFILPLFVQESPEAKTPISSMPGQFRYNPDQLVQEALEAQQLGIPAVALFPAIEPSKKDEHAKESYNPNGLLPQVVRRLKKEVPGLTIITDVAMDPYSSDGHDGIVQEGTILNDATLEVLGKMAVCQAEAGADIIAPSDMMDGRVFYLREVLDQAGYEEVGILSYAAKYASAFYGPFRDALDSAPADGKDIPKDKKTYQMNPANTEEAVREVLLDIEEGADMVIVKPGLPYLDIIQKLRSKVQVPLAAYHVSGEYAMIYAAAEKGWLDLNSSMMESLLAFKRAGANMILTYFAKEACRLLQESGEY